MAAKRPREDDANRPSKKIKKGFSVGPANLPDGTYRRKVQKIKKDLVHKAKLKKQYAKLKARQNATAQDPVSDLRDDDAQTTANAPEPNLEPHPDRMRMLDEPPKAEPESTHPADQRRGRRPRTQPFRKESELARKKKEEEEARQGVREEAANQRVRKVAERERFRKVMAKARGGGPTGQRKLGRESVVLLEKAKRLMGKS